MVLRGDVDYLSLQIFDRLVAAMVAELELEGPGAQSQRDDLMAQADPEDGNLAGKVLDGIDGLQSPLRVAWTVGEKEGLGPHSLDLGDACMSGKDMDIESPGREALQNVSLDPQVDHCHPGARPPYLIVSLAGDIPQQVPGGDVGLGAGHLDDIQGGELFF